MSPVAGSRVGPFEIQSAIGAGAQTTPPKPATPILRLTPEMRRRAAIRIPWQRLSSSIVR